MNVVYTPRMNYELINSYGHHVMHITRCVNVYSDAMSQFFLKIIYISGYGSWELPKRPKTLSRVPPKVKRQHIQSEPRTLCAI